MREAIAKQHRGNLAEHFAETNRIAEELREKLRLGKVVLCSHPFVARRGQGRKGETHDMGGKNTTLEVAKEVARYAI